MEQRPKYDDVAIKCGGQWLSSKHSPKEGEM